MRIALFTDTYPPQVNGVARTLRRLVDHATDRGHEVAVVSPRQPDGQAMGGALHVELASVPAPFYPALRLALPLDPWNARRLREFAPDVAHVATEATIGWSGAVWAADRGIPLVSSFHTDFPAYLAGYGLGGLEAATWRWLASFHNRASITYCPSEATLAQLGDHDFHDRLRIWSRGVDARTFRPDRRSAEVRRRWAPNADVVLLYVGRLAPEKRLDLLFDAFGAIRREAGERVALVVVGDGPQREAIEARAEPGVVFTGFLVGDELADTYAAADIFAFPSDTETFGNVVLEAMASGLPAVVPDRGGVTDSVTDGVNGRIFPAGDTGAFADALRTLIGEEAVRWSMANEARTHALTRSWSQILDEVLAGYALLVEAAAVRAA